jgi:hypothetical protein
MGAGEGLEPWRLIEDVDVEYSNAGQMNRRAKGGSASLNTLEFDQKEKGRWWGVGSKKVEFNRERVHGSNDKSERNKSRRREKR